MSVTCGFFNSENHDRKYSATQMSSLFDGILRDGIFMSIGDCLVVQEESGMVVVVGTGRAWFNHTWTLNDSLLPLVVPRSEVILDRIDAVVLEVNHDPEVRQNSIKIVKGVPSATPRQPDMVNTELIHQYPLAFIEVRAGVEEITQDNITNMVGTSSTPFVTGILDTVDIDALIAQWRVQWRTYFNEKTAEIDRTEAFWNQQLSDFYHETTAQWDTYYGDKTEEIDAIAQSLRDEWYLWFIQHTNLDQAEFNTWLNGIKDEWETWFSGLQDDLTPSQAATLANEIEQLKLRTNKLETCCNSLVTDQAIYPPIDDSNNEFVLDSNNEPIDGSILFVIK